MKTILKNQRIINKFGKMLIIEKVKQHMIMEINLNLFSCFINQYRYCRLYKKRMNFLFTETKKEIQIELENQLAN